MGHRSARALPGIGCRDCDRPSRDRARARLETWRECGAFLTVRDVGSQRGIPMPNWNWALPSWFKWSGAMLMVALFLVALYRAVVDGGAGA